MDSFVTPPMDGLGHTPRTMSPMVSPAAMAAHTTQASATHRSAQSSGSCRCVVCVVGDWVEVSMYMGRRTPTPHTHSYRPTLKEANSPDVPSGPIPPLLLGPLSSCQGPKKGLRGFVCWCCWGMGLAVVVSAC